MSADEGANRRSREHGDDDTEGDREMAGTQHERANDPRDTAPIGLFRGEKAGSVRHRDYYALTWPDFLQRHARGSPATISIDFPGRRCSIGSAGPSARPAVCRAKSCMKRGKWHAASVVCFAAAAW